MIKAEFILLGIVLVGLCALLFCDIWFPRKQRKIRREKRHHARRIGKIRTHVWLGLLNLRKTRQLTYQPGLDVQDTPDE